MRRNTVSIALVVVLCIATVPMLAGATPTASVIGSPELDLSIADNRLEQSERTTLTVTVSNSGEIRRGGPGALVDRVTTARNVKLDVLESEVDAPIEVKTGSVSLGAVTTQGPKSASFTVETGESLEPGTYRLPVRVTYDYTRVVNYDEIQSPPGYADPQYGDGVENRVEYLTLVVDESAHFRVTTSSTENLHAGDTGTLSFSVENTGSQTARDATVNLHAQSPNLFFGAPTNPKASTSLFLPTLAPDESATLSVNVGATSEISPGTYPIRSTVTYQNENDVATTSDPATVGVRVAPERKLAIENLQTQGLRVGEDDVVVSGEIANVGDVEARNAVVRLTTANGVRVTGPEAAVGTLAPGESKPVTFKLAVPEDAEPGTRSLSFAVEYENADGELRALDNPIRKPVTVEAERPLFDVVETETSLEAGGSAQLRVTFTYNGDRPISDATGKLFVNDPISATDNGEFIGAMEPGETKTATFTVSAADRATAKAYTGSLEIRYDDATGETELEDGMQLGIPVQDAGGGLPIPYIGAGLGVVALAGGVFVWRRR